MKITDIREETAQSKSDLNSLLAELEELMEDIDAESMHLDGDSAEAKELSRDYKALHAVENVIRNNLIAERGNMLDKNIFHYDINPEEHIWGGVHVQIKGNVGEIKWVGSYNSSGRKLIIDVMPELKNRGVKKIELVAKWESEGFYDKMNFKRDSETRHDPIAGTTYTNMSKGIDESIKYPIASRDDWYGDLQYKQAGAKMVMMSPDKYIAKVRPLSMDDESVENIDILAQHMLDGNTLDPLKIYPDGKEDGRHRAYAAKKLGIAKVPVIVYPQSMKESKKNRGESYKLQLLRSPNEDVLKVLSNRQPSWVEIRGKPNYETSYDPNDRLHKFLDKLDAPTVAALMSGDTKFLSPNNSRTTPSINMAKTTMANEEQLNELFDSTYNWSWANESGDFWSANIQDGKTTIPVKFIAMSHGSKNYEVEFQKNSSNKRSEEGDEFRIFSTVIKVIEEFFQKNPEAESINFAAHREGEAATSAKIRDSRASLYTKLMQRFANKHNMDFASQVIGRMTEFQMRRRDMNEDIKKPHPDDTLGVKRHEMPQVHAKHYSELFDYLKGHGAKIIRKDVPATTLKAVQSEFSDEGVEKMIRKGGVTGDGTKKPLIVSADNYIIDGHHRWLASYNLGENVPILQISLSVTALLQLVRDFKHTTYKDIYNEDDDKSQFIESFDNPYPYEWTNKVSPYGAKFKTDDGSKVEFSANSHTMEEFREDLFANGIPIDDLPPYSDSAVWDIAFARDGDFDMTGDGDAQRIFATIIAMITEFYRMKAPDLISFSADKSNYGINGSRAKLYSRLAKMFARKIGYNMQFFDAGAEAVFFLSRKTAYTQMEMAIMEGGHNLDDLDENISVVGSAHSKADRKKKLRPGSEAWFKHWFSRPKLTREEVDNLKSQIKGVCNEKTIRSRGINRN